MKQLTRTQRTTRTERRQQEDKHARWHIAWHLLGIIICLAVITYFNLWNPTMVIALLGGAEFILKGWQALWKWLGV